MFEDLLKLARDPAGWHNLEDLSKEVWRLYGAGKLTDDQASTLQHIIQQRLTHHGQDKPKPRGPVRPRAYVGGRRRSQASRTRGQRAIAYGFMPPDFYGGARAGIMSVLAVIGHEAMTKGRCKLYVDQIGAFAGYCRTTVQDAIRYGELQGWLKVERSRSGRRNLANVITVVCPRWLAWLTRKRPTWRGWGRGNGFNFAMTTRTGRSEGAGLTARNTTRGRPTAAEGLPGGESARAGPARLP